MEIEESPGSSFRSLKMSLVDIFIDKYEGTGDKIFHSFGIYDNSLPAGIDRMKDTATYARSSLHKTKDVTWSAVLMSHIETRVDEPKL